MTDDDLAPDMRRFQQQHPAASEPVHPPLSGVSLAEARRSVDAVRAPPARGGPPLAFNTSIVRADVVPRSVRAPGRRGAWLRGEGG